MRRPNILILHTDQQRYDTLAANGNADIHTPHLDRLAATGVNFSHHFVQNPVCMPSRISFFTGQYPSTLGIPHMGVPVPTDTFTLPMHLSPYGYRSAYFGKMHFEPHANRDHTLPRPRYGFDQVEVADNPGIYEEAYRAWVRKQAPEHMDVLSPGHSPVGRAWRELMHIDDTVVHAARESDHAGPIVFPAPDHLTHTAFVASRTMDFVNAQPADGDPWLCVAGFYAPHAPWRVPQKYIDLYDPDALTLPTFPEDVEKIRHEKGFTDERLRAARHGYYASISEIDDWVGRILDTLDERGIADETLIVFTSDHGERLGDYLSWAKGPPGRESVARVPLIVRYPGWQAEGVAGRSREEIVEAVDVLPTLLEAAGVQVPPFLQGRSLAPALRGESISEKPALMECAGLKTLRTKTHRYVLRGNGREHLWDLTVPHGEYTDLADDPAHAAALSEHRARLAQRLIEIERPRPRTWPY